MIKKILPIVLLLIGTGAGVGAGIFLRPEATEIQSHDVEEVDEHKESADHKEMDDHANEDEEPGQSENEYVKLNNQFVVPLIKGEKIASLVVIALSLEVPVGTKDNIFLHEPKLRDSFLQVLFDHANIGGFEGSFTEVNRMAVLRTSLREVAQRDLGKSAISDVLILEIARQDY